MKIRNIGRAVVFIFAFAALLIAPEFSGAQNQNKVMGQVDFVGKTKPEKTAGVWVDDQYVGYVDELTGDKQVMLLPGRHKISVRQTGYLNMDQEIVADPGKKVIVTVALEKNPKAEFSSVTAQVKLEVTPDRAAVLVDGAFAGTVHDFGGVGRSMLIAPGKHHIKIDLVGYQPFDTDVNLQPNQKITIKTDLAQGAVSQTDPALKGKP
jgi:hypothetical protein